MVKKRNNRKKKPHAQDVSSEERELFLDAVANLSHEVVAEKLAAESDDGRAASTVARSRASGPAVTIDLHGLRLDEAMQYIRDELAPLWQSSTEVTVVTGKGRHSEGGGVLVKEIYGRMQNEFAGRLQFLDSDPGQDLLNGLPIRGYFRVRVK